jgi:hypothetical protein
MRSKLRMRTMMLSTAVTTSTTTTPLTRVVWRVRALIFFKGEQDPALELLLRRPRSVYTHLFKFDETVSRSPGPHARLVSWPGLASTLMTEDRL